MRRMHECVIQRWVGVKVCFQILLGLQVWQPNRNTDSDDTELYTPNSKLSPEGNSAVNSARVDNGGDLLCT